MDYAAMVEALPDSQREYINNDTWKVECGRNDPAPRRVRHQPELTGAEERIAEELWEVINANYQISEKGKDNGKDSNGLRHQGEAEE